MSRFNIQSIKYILKAIGRDDIPTIEMDKFTDITLNFLERNNITHLIIDLDQTIVEPKQAIISDDYLEHLDILIKNISLKNICFLTNEADKNRAKLIKKTTGIDVIWGEYKKPDKSAYDKALKYLNTKPSMKVATIGDRIWTDIVGGNGMFITTIQVKPLSPNKDKLLTTLVRKIEKNFQSSSKL